MIWLAPLLYLSRCSHEKVQSYFWQQGKRGRRTTLRKYKHSCMFAAFFLDYYNIKQFSTNGVLTAAAFEAKTCYEQLCC